MVSVILLGLSYEPLPFVTIRDFFLFYFGPVVCGNWGVSGGLCYDYRMFNCIGSLIKINEFHFLNLVITNIVLLQNNKIYFALPEWKP